MKKKYIGTKFWNKLIDKVKARHVDDLHKEQNQMINEKLNEIHSRVSKEATENEKKYLLLIKERINERKKNTYYEELRGKLKEMPGDDLYFLGERYKEKQLDLSSILSYKENSILI